jgi:hypothetical protein
MTGSDKRRHRVRLAAGALVIVAVAAAGLGLYVARVQQARVDALVAAAKAQGITLKLGQVERSLFGVSVADSPFTVTAGPVDDGDLTGTIERLSVGLFSDAVTAHGVHVRAQGEPLALFESWMHWARKRQARADRSDSLVWRDVELSLTPAPGPQIILADATSETAAKGSSFMADQLSVGGLTWSAVVGIIEPRKKGLEVGFGSRTLSQAPVRWLYFRTPPVSRMSLTVRPENLGVLLDRSRVLLTNTRARNMRALSTLNLVVRDGEPTLRGTLGLTLDDFAHPQLSQPGRLFGSTAAFFGRLETDREMKAWQLPFMQATLPPFTLRGQGQLDRDGDGIRLRARLHGRGECARLASLLEPSPLRQKVEGAVAAATEKLPPLEITLLLDIATRHLDEAIVAWQIGAACGLPALAQDRAGAVEPATDKAP